MQIKISDKIYLTEIEPVHATAIKKGLTIPNKLYEQMAKRCKFAGGGKWRKALYGIKKEFKYYEEKDGVLIIGRGNEAKMFRYISNAKISCKFEYDVSDAKFEGLNGNIALRDYQVGVPEEILKNYVGTAKLSTGYGKTIIALKLIELSKAKTLIIAFQTKELDKYVADLKRYYNYTAGVIHGNKADIQDVTVASISTLVRRDLSSLKYQFGIVICDECQNLVSDARIKAIQSFAPRRLYGMSGTPERDDSIGDSIFFTFGDIIIDRELPQTKPTVKIVKSNIDIPVDDYADMIAGMVDNKERNDLIVKLCVEQVRSGRKVLILTKRTCHYKAIGSVLSDLGYKTYTINSKLNAEEKKLQQDLLEQLGNGNSDFDIILGTYSLLAVGANFPALDTLIFAGDLRAQVLGKQAIGRILRLMEGKQDPSVIDICDNLNPILLSQARARKRLYKDNEFIIK